MPRSPTLDTVMMVDSFIRDHSGDYRKTELFRNLPRKVMWQTFQVIMAHLVESRRIVYDRDGFVVYIWNPSLAAHVAQRPVARL